MIFLKNVRKIFTKLSSSKSGFTLVRTLVRKNLASAHAFTLVELLVVIAVIGILASLTLVSYQGVQKTGRDSKRKVDLEQIKAAVKMYQQDKGTFPTGNSLDTSVGRFSGSCTSPDSDWESDGIKGKLGPNYFAKLPLDPINDCTAYYAYKLDATGFWVGGVLENPGSSTCDSASEFSAPINYCLKAN